MFATDPTAYAYVGDDDAEYFRIAHGKQLAISNVYLLPVDEDAVKRSDIHHRMMQFVFQGRNYIGPVKEALQFGQQRRILDLGTGGGFWAIDIADEFPRAEVIGIDIAPIQPRMVPSNCTFELCDLDQLPIPYPDNYFDFIHARSIHIGIRDYPRLLKEIARILRPGGFVLLIEPDLYPRFSNHSLPVSAPILPSSLPLPQPLQQTTTSKFSISSLLNSSPSHGNSTPTLGSSSDISIHTSCKLSADKQQGWFTLWKNYRACLRVQGIDATVPTHLSDLLSATGQFEKIVSQKQNIPVGFWPQDDTSLTVGQLQWMDYDLFVPALRPLFLFHNIPPSQVNRLIQEAQNDLYRPTVCQFSQLHIVYASKTLR